MFKQVDRICKEIDREHDDVLPVSPIHLFSYKETDRDGSREYILEVCFELIKVCDEVWVCGEISNGVLREIRFAEMQGIPVKHCPNLNEASGKVD